MQVLEQENRIILPAVVDRTNVKELDQAFQLFCDKGCNCIIVDCVNLEMIDSAGLGSLVLYQKRMKEQGGEITICNATNEYIEHLFDTIELDRVIRIQS